jgi:hypothetical protein
MQKAALRRFDSTARAREYASTMQAASTVATKALSLSFTRKEDIDEIIEEHLKNGRVVERLRI